MSSSMDPHLPNHRKQYPFNGRQIASRVVTLPVCESPVCEPPARQASTVPENRLDAGSPTQVLPKTTSRVRDRLQTQAKVSRAIYIKFLGLPAQDLRVRDVWTLCSRFGNVAVSDLVNTVSGQVAIVGWFDHRNAVQAIEALSKMDHLYQCDFIFDCHLDSYGDISNLSALSNSAASVFCLPVRGDIPPSSLRAELEQFGEVEHLCEVPHFPAVHLCRYYNILSALNILTKAETIKTTLIVTSDMIGLLENYAFKDYMMFRHSSVQSTGRYQKSKWKTIASWLPKMHTAEINSQAWAVGNENTASSTSQRNEVSVGRVLLGQDNRNTIMIKNIPNNYHRDDLKSYLDVTNKGTYDFLCMNTSSILHNGFH
ncbi:unnamed protein product [Kuraishia capsulata CBS 1993]|uniref:Mei2-like C-terminal RNA recognition motif domain-containing protein n=1 Tax=Kuraishia capsulata CBS 1993 TaxID=1382522 RepID=W6MGR4_9ASCO|nr:uncharacterized protein KUCA_T00000993001 [Kuraishia capsulata CBS 1993]CDK25026.1 unnamed protein product [Kuraishia capsulata CBS 1993]